MLLDVISLHVFDDALEVVGRVNGDGLALYLDVVHVIAVLDKPEDLDVLDRLDLGFAVLLAIIAIEL